MERVRDSDVLAGAGADLRPAAGEGLHDAGLHDQLYRYAEDLQQAIARQELLQSSNDVLRKACARLSENSERLDVLIGRSPDVHVVTDETGRILRANPASARLASASRLLGTSLRERALPADRAAFDALRQAALDDAAANGQGELRLHCDEGGRAPLFVSAQVFVLRREADGCHLHWILRDITRLREIQLESQLSSLVFKHAAEGVMVTDSRGEILAVNPAFSRITGYAAEEVVGRSPKLLRSGMHDDDFYAGFWQSLITNGSWQGEIYNRRKNGEIYSEWLTVNAARDAGGGTISYVAVLTDLSRIIKTEKRLAYLAHHDMLTGLPNRVLFQERLEQSFVQSRRTKIPFTLIFIDLDRFKQINDSLGHEVGDRVLIEASRRLAAVVREQDTLARLGGDEFVVIAPGLAGRDDIAKLCNKLLGALDGAILEKGQELFIGGSLGCATSPFHGSDELVLLKHADLAMYRAKAGGGNNFVIHDAADTVEDNLLHLQSELRHALERGQLRLEYQPQIASDNGDCIGVEALLRWDHPQFGCVPPAQFVPVAEQVGLIVAIGNWVLQTACVQLAAWDAQGLPPLSMAVNLSPRQLREPALVDSVRVALDAGGIAAERLELEVTESEVMFHLEGDRSKLDALRDLGVRIAMDDFGTGYSSLARLMQLPIDSLKLDRSFLCSLEREGCVRAAAITEAIVAMVRALGVGLVAEGVETEAQYELLVRQGCQVIQGYLTGRPMPPAALAGWVLAGGSAAAASRQ